MILRKTKINSGFVILFAVTLAGIVLAIAVGVANIALKEVKFITSAKDSNNAFYAADTAIESVLFDDKFSSSSPYTAPGTYSDSFNNLGPTGNSCATVTVTKTSSPVTTTIISKGYNVSDCSLANSNLIERELKITYGGGWIFCADENGTCSFPGTKQVRYGENGLYNYLNATNSIACNNATFGDPIVGTFKHCHYNTAP